MYRVKIIYFLTSFSPIYSQVQQFQTYEKIYKTREIALMIQLEQQQHREFWVGGRVGRVGDIPTTYIQLTCGWINIK